MKTTLLLILTLFSLSTIAQDKLQKWYDNSVRDAAFPEESELSDQLSPINKDNKNLIWQTIDGKDYVLVNSWKADGKYYPTSGDYNTGKYPIWVSLSSEFGSKAKALKLDKSKDPDLRLKQLLGLPPTVEKNVFIEFWVLPESLYRPCLDPEINDNSCTLCATDNIDEEHYNWIKNQRNESYYGCKGDKYPWTQMGYTYDWHPRNKTHVGLSEYILKKNQDVIIELHYTTEEFIEHRIEQVDE